MNDQIEPTDAARALSEIGRRREQAIRRAAIPRWFWWVTAVLTIGWVADLEFLRGALSWAGTALFWTASLAIAGLMRFREFRAPLSPGLVAPGSVPRMMAGAAALLAVVTGVGLATKLSLEAARVPYPGMIASAAAMAVMVAGGQMLVRYHTGLLVRWSGGR